MDIMKYIKEIMDIMKYIKEISALMKIMSSSPSPGDKRGDKQSLNI
jgi:hypothetical protein